jgi:tRNA pseudouridine55 synthase
VNVHKPTGLTSHDVVERVRKASGFRRVGHAGTLDPLAEGVLLVCFGQGTRVTRYLTEGRKVYRASIHLGVATDTGDAEGQILSNVDIGEMPLERIEEALASFRGSILQVPPLFSALKRKGVPLYRLARRGVKAELPPRPVEIYRLEVIDWTSPVLSLEVECSPGTYLRALARDLGERLGCGGHISSLVRLASGHFTLEGAVSPKEVEERFASGRWGEITHPIDEALLRFEALLVDEEGAQMIRRGQGVAGEPLNGPLARAYSPEGKFLALLAFREGQWWPIKVFV